MQSTADIVWLKRDVRLVDHGPLAEVACSSRPLLIIYNYEPDQLSEPSVHGSHVSFVNEGLIELDQKLSSGVERVEVLSDASAGYIGLGSAFVKAGSAAKSADSTNTTPASASTYTGDTNSIGSSGSDKGTASASIDKVSRGEDRYTFRVITVCHAGVVFTLDSILKQIKAGAVFANNTQVTGIYRILAHEETGHLKSFSRDKAVRKWCRNRNIPITEYNQTGVTRCLKSRDNFSTLFQIFLNQPLWKTPSTEQLKNMRSRLINNLKLYNRCQHPLYPHNDEIQEIPVHHRKDRPQRQKGGEAEGQSSLNSFLQNRARHYSSGISSPNTSWTTGGRISPYVTWGHLSTRYIIHQLKCRQDELRLLKGTKQLNPIDGPFLRSLQAFSSRMHWRSHFIQKLESEPEIERRDLCSSYQHLRRQEGDWNELYYERWITGTTGFPFVDACMRCLLQHGWLNFRMRAMLVSFATYNLWLDWKKIAPHLARVFLDYEPGIHYPQLQMQAGTTGINAMRVYNVTKQGNDQDPDGVFVKKYVPELRNVPTEYIHEPSQMTLAVQKRCNITIGFPTENRSKGKGINGQTEIRFASNMEQKTDAKKMEGTDMYQHYYPMPIINEKESAKVAKDKMAQIRKLGSTKQVAEKVYIKHGSRSSRNGNMDGIKPKALSSTVKRVKLDTSMESGQSTIRQMFQGVNNSLIVAQRGGCVDNTDGTKRNDPAYTSVRRNEPKKDTGNTPSDLYEIWGTKSNHVIDLADEKKNMSNKLTHQRKNNQPDSSTVNTETCTKTTCDEAGSWSCSACTYLNKKPFALSCLVCGTLRQ